MLIHTGKLPFLNAVALPMATEQEYILGINQQELDRLGFQHGVWKKVTDEFFDRIGVGQGWHCLDVGAGPGFVSIDLRERVGNSGSVTALEPGFLYLEHFDSVIRNRGWNNVSYVQGTAETADLPHKHYDLIFVRWVIGFVPDPALFISNLTQFLKPGGVLAIQDYLYSGLGLYPKGGAFDGALEMVIRHWAVSGGDAFIAARIPRLFKDNDLEVIDYSPHCQAGGPDSDVIEWADRFFTKHMHLMVESGATTAEEGQAMLDDWYAHRNNPDTIFCSPILVDVAGKKRE